MCVLLLLLLLLGMNNGKKELFFALEVERKEEWEEEVDGNVIKKRGRGGSGFN